MTHVGHSAKRRQGKDDDGEYGVRGIVDEVEFLGTFPPGVVGV